MDDIVERLEPALKLLPIKCHDTPDYAEATGPQFQAMTMVPEAFLALNSLPDALDEIRTLRTRIAELEKALRPFSLIAGMEEAAGPSDSVMVNVARCRDARSALTTYSTLKGQSDG